MRNIFSLHLLLFIFTYAVELIFCTLCKFVCNWFNKEADWPIEGQDEVRQENQTEDTGKKKGEIRGVTRQMQGKRDMYKMG